MKIAYLGQMADITTENGISKKVRAQGATWMAAGHCVRYFAAVPRPVAWEGLAPLETELVPRGRGWGRVHSAKALCRKIEHWNPDIIYFRYAYHATGLPRLFARFPTIGEVNSDDRTEYALTLSVPKRIYHRWTRRFVLGRLRGIVAVTNELAQRFATPGLPVTTIGNSIELASFAPLPIVPPSAVTRLVFIGNTQTPWHGLDRLGEIAKALPSTEFIAIGCTVADVRAVAPSMTPPPNLKLLGMLPNDRYAPMLAGACAAVGTLGLFRKRMDEACPLKVREYLALGLPVIGAYRDTDIPDDADYFLRLPNNAKPLDPWRDRIADFIEHWRTHRVPRATIAHLDVSVKEAQRLAFMTEIRERFLREHA